MLTSWRPRNVTHKTSVRKLQRMQMSIQLLASSHVFTLSPDNKIESDIKITVIVQTCVSRLYFTGRRLRHVVY